MEKYITFVEGESEKSIIEWLKPKGYRFGRTRKVVISELKHIERTLFMIDKHTTVTVLMDTDTIYSGETNTQRLKDNLVWLIQNVKKVRIITQNKNLEDELTKALALEGVKELVRYFGERNLDGLKSAITTWIPEKLDNKLNHLNFNLFWSTKLLDQFYQERFILVLNCTLGEIK